MSRCRKNSDAMPHCVLSMASEGERETPEQKQKHTSTNPKATQAIERLMAKHDPILLFASKLLPPDKAADASALYAWCRRLDEICDNEDNAHDPKMVNDQLGVWQTRFEALWTPTTAAASGNDNDNDNDNDNNNNDYPEDEYLMDLALRDCIEKYQGGDSTSTTTSTNRNSLLTRVPFDDMIEGMKSDAVEGRRIETMEELELYAYRVAGTVGLMLLPLLLSDETDNNGNNNDNDHGADADARPSTLLAIGKAREPAICLGKAIQLVNILRDATQDAKLGRIYLPQTMLRDEGVDDESILAVALEPTASGDRNDDSQSQSPASVTPRGYKTVVQTVSGRAEELLAEAEAGKDTLPAPLGPLFVQIIVELYRDYLDELRRRDYDNLSSIGGIDRVKISTLRKVLASLRAFAKVGKEAIFGRR